MAGRVFRRHHLPLPFLRILCIFAATPFSICRHRAQFASVNGLGILTHKIQSSGSLS
jgi:hypothetical protein